VLLVDLRSPDTSVLEFARSVHDASLVPPLRTVLISGRGQAGDAQRARELGVAAYLTKPIGPEDLLACLSTVLRTAPASAGSGSPSDLVTRYTLENRQPRLKGPVLIVEDNVVNQKVLVGLLRKLGFSAEVANNGVEALAALEHASYPLVFMDSQMPVMDGFATTAAIRRREGADRRTIIVAVTAHAMKGVRERCLEAGMDDYLSKPISLDRLSEVMDRWLGTERPASEIAVVDTAPDSLEAHPQIDHQVLSRLRELEADVPGLVSDVVGTFLRETPGRIARLQEAFESGDAGAAAAAAHGLKGSAGAIGALRLAHLCSEIEDACRHKTTDDCARSVAALAGEFERSRDILQRTYLSAAMS
jgi:two-component system, sensor histidine kinase and response regulator